MALVRALTLLLWATACTAGPVPPPADAAKVTAARPNAAPEVTVTAEPVPQPSAASDETLPLTTPVQPEATPEPDPVAAVLSHAPDASTSLGGPSSGTITGAVRLPSEGPGFFHNPKRPADAGYGSVELIQCIVRAAAVVERELPGSRLTVNDVGLQGGGPIRQHGSHQSGRDADILFYVFDAQGDPIPSVGVPIDPKGNGWDFKDLADPQDDQRVRLDAARTWRFVHAFIDSCGEQLQRIFIVEHVRTRLLAQAEKVGASQAVRDRFSEVTCQPSSPHDDHMHVRLFCAPDDIDAGCQDSPPIYPWRTQALAALGIEPMPARPLSSRAERSAVAERTTSPEQARKRAGPMHASVLKFLNERRAWLQQPHPGRTYCR